MFPFTAEDTIEFPLHGNEEHIRDVVIGVLIGKLREEQAEDAIRTDGTIKFTMPVFRQRRWFRFDFLGAVRGGEIEVQVSGSKLLIHYSISFVGSIIGITVLVIMMALVAQPALQQLTVPAQVFLGLLWWVIIVGGIVVLTRFMFSTLIYTTVMDVVDALSPKESGSAAS